MTTGRTEPPTPRRLRQARRRGEIASSRELTSAAALVAGVAGLVLAGPATARALAEAVRAGVGEALAAADEPELRRAASRALLQAVVLLARAALPPCGAAALGAAAAGALQARGLFTLRAVAWRLDRLHPAEGLARMLSPERWAAAALGMLRAALVLGAAWLLVRLDLPALLQAPRLEPAALLRVLPALGGRPALAMGLLLLAAGALDLGLGGPPPPPRADDDARGAAPRPA